MATTSRTLFGTIGRPDSWVTSVNGSEAAIETPVDLPSGATITVKRDGSWWYDVPVQLLPTTTGMPMFDSVLCAWTDMDNVVRETKLLLGSPYLDELQVTAVDQPGLDYAIRAMAFSSIPVDIHLSRCLDEVSESAIIIVTRPSDDGYHQLPDGNILRFEPTPGFTGDTSLGVLAESHTGRALRITVDYTITPALTSSVLDDDHSCVS